MATVGNRLKETFENARRELHVIERKVLGFEKRAAQSFDEVPGQLKGAWETVVDRVRGALDFATHEDLKDLQGRVDVLQKKVDKIVHEKVRAKSPRKAD